MNWCDKHQTPALTCIDCGERREQQRALEAAVVEAALRWHDPLHHDDAAPWENALDDACAALRKFRQRESGR